MRSYVPAYELQAPSSVEAALHLLAEGWQPFAGGTDLMVLLEAGRLAERRYAGLWRLDELRGIEEHAGSVAVGALTSFAEIRRSPLLAAEFPLLVQAAGVIGAGANQNRATLGGNLANASPAADSAPALLVYDAELELVSREGARRAPYCRFHHAYKRMDLRPGELIARIHLPRGKAGWRCYWRKVATRSAQAITKVSLAGAAHIEDGRIVDIRLAYGAVAPYPLRAVRAEDALRGALLAALPEPPDDEIAPIDDLRSTARYRRVVARNLLREFLSSLA